MIKKVNHFFQSIFVYFFFLVGRILGLNICRKFFSFLFIWLGPIFKSKKIIHKNLNIVCKKNSSINKIKIERDMWKNYGKHLSNIFF